MPEQKGGFYEKEGVPQEEIERLKIFEYPTYVSETLLEAEPMDGKRFLDAGAGANSGLAQYVEKRNGVYIPLDLRMEMLKSLKDSMPETLAFEGVNADVRKLPFGDGSIDIAHQRFVLMHLSPDERRRVVEELLRVAKEEIFLLEYNWGTMKSSQHESRLGEFLTASADLSKKLGIEQLMGEKLEALLRDESVKMDYEMTHFNRDEGDYTRDLIGLAGMSAKMALIRLKDKTLSDKFAALEAQFKEEPITFIPAEIVAARIKK